MPPRAAAGRCWTPGPCCPGAAGTPAFAPQAPEGLVQGLPRLAGVADVPFPGWCLGVSGIWIQGLCFGFNLKGRVLGITVQGSVFW